MFMSALVKNRDESKFIIFIAIVNYQKISVFL